MKCHYPISKPAQW